MTIQNKTTVQLGAIQWGKGFNQSLAYPEERLEKFLNVDTADENAIAQYCSEFKYLPRNYFAKKSLSKTFIQEQSKLKEIAIKVLNNQLTNKDVETINKNLPTKKLKVVLTNLAQIVDQLPKQDEIEPHAASRDRSKYLLDEYSVSGTLSILWEDLVRLALSTQNLRTCVNCGKFFTRKSRHLQITCSPECQEARKKRNQRKKS